MNPKTRLRILLGGVALLLAVLGTLGWLRPAPVGAPESLLEEPALELRWRPGTSQQYRVRVDSTFQMNAAEANPTLSLQVRLEGVLDAQTLEAGPAQTLVGMRLSTVELQVGGKTEAQTNLALAVPFRVRFASGGLPEAFEFPAAVTAEHRDMLENLVRTFQVAMGQGQSWVAQEPNASGTYEAAYLRSAPTRLEKRKLHFVDAAPATAGAVAEIASTESIRLEAGRDWIVAMNVDEVVRSKGQGGPAVEVTSHASLKLQSVSSTHAAVEADGWRFVAAPVPVQLARAEAATSAPSPEAARQQLADGLSALDAAREGRSLLIHRLRDLIRSDGKLASVLLESMKTLQLSDRTRADLYLVFELAGSPQAQAALRSVLTDTSWSQRDAMRAIVALGGVARPGADTVSALWRSARSGPAGTDGGPLASTATLALGSLGNRLNAARDTSYPTLRAGLLNGALSGGNSRLRANYVHAIGNTGDVSLARDIVALLEDADPRLRSAAAQSLGRLGSSDVADALLRRLQLERSDVVRGSIAEALASWKSPMAPAVEWVRAAIGSEPDENTRYHMARMLGTSMSAHPVNTEVLQDVQRFEQSRRIRHYIAEALAKAN